MKKPEPVLSRTERGMLKAIAAGNPDDAIPDFVAFQRLKSFGYISVQDDAQPKITAEGKKALWEKPPDAD